MLTNHNISNNNIIEENNMNPDLIKEVEGDDKLNSGEINLQVNQKNKKTEDKNNFENYMTEYETKTIGHIIQIIPLFLDSVIDLFNQIISIYKCQKKLPYINKDKLFEKLSIKIIKYWRLLDIIIFDNPKNNDIIFFIIELEKKKGKTIFEALINLKFKELYDYFIHNCTIVTWGWYIYDLRDIFKTLVDMTKGNKELIGKEYDLDLLDKMEIETINLEDSILTFN